MDKRIFILILGCLNILAVFSQEAWYEVKSGIIHSKVNAGGIILDQKEYFEEWGNLVAIESIMGLNEYALKTRTLYGDKFMTMIKTETNEAIRYPRVRPRINWLKLDEITEKAYNIRYLGRVKLQEYTCDLYIYTIQDNGRAQEVTNWVYKGIPIQYKTVNNGIAMEQQFISLDENPVIDRTLFEVPADIEIHEQQHL